MPQTISSKITEASAGLARSILVTLFIGLFATVVVALIAPENDDAVTLAFYTPVFALLVTVGWLLHRGKIRLGGQALTGVLYLVAIGAVILLGGIKANATSAFIVSIMVAAALLGARWALVWTALTVITVTALAALEMGGYLPQPIAPRDSMANALMGTLFPLVFAVWILYRMLAIRRIALDEATRREAERDKAEADLIQAQKMDVVGRLSSGIAHDFNNLLTVIRSSVDVLKLDGADDPLLDDIEDSARRAGMLTRRLLAFARPRDFEPRPIELGDVLEDFAPLLQTIAGDEIELNISYVPGCAAVLDPLALQQIVLNLVINSREALDGRGQISLEATCTQQWVTLMVCDDGPGFPAEHRASIFEPFFTTKESGTGLGLATVKQLVNDSQGTIHVRNTDEGATFVIRWPTRHDIGLDEISTTTNAASIDIRPHILVVDDNEPVRRSMAALLGMQRWEITEASDGLEALSTLERTSPDLVVTDNAMPGITGVELAQRIRDAYPELPILIVSGNSLTELPVDRCAFLAKPFGGESLKKTIVELLTSSEQLEVETA